MKRGKIFSIMAAIARRSIFAVAMLMSASCLNDKIENFYPYFRFEVSVNDGLNKNSEGLMAGNNAGTNNDVNISIPKFYILKGEDSADTLFLHATASDGIKSYSIPEVSNETDTKRAEIQNLNGSFGLMAFVSSDRRNEETSNSAYMYNVEVTQSSNWTTKYSWPDEGKNLCFFAYSPYNGKGIKLSPRENAEKTKIIYTVPDLSSEQNDLLSAVKEVHINAAVNMSVQLTFQHLLAMVKFETEEADLKDRIEQITLKNIFGKGIYRMDGGWSGQTDIKNFTHSLNSGEQIDEQNNNIYCKPGTSNPNSLAAFMMIPQTLPAGAQIEIKYRGEDNISKTLTTDISGKWSTGKTVTYRLSTIGINVETFIEVNGPDDFTYQGGRNKYSVKSYATVSHSDGTGIDTIPMAWTAEYIDFAGNPVSQDWLNLTLKGNGGNETTYYSENYEAVASPQTGIYSNQHNIALQNASPLGSANDPYNLSNSIGALDVENSANCYLINAPGYYQLPLVYGNAIKDGNSNESAYISTKSGANILKNFVNHLDMPIVKPYIYDNQDCVPGSALLVWQDEENLVTNVELSTDKHFLTFEVPKENIKQGNAVVAVKDGSGMIMWSWHIWVTDYKLGIDLKTVTDPADLARSYTFLPCNLGWCDANTTTYDERSVKVRFTQTKTKESSIITITQKPYSVSVGANNPYYQWGRKDPMRPADGTNKNKIWYDANGLPRRDSIIASWAVDSTIIPNGIKNPQTFCTNIAMDNKYINLWNIDNNSIYEDLETSVKTIYDPSPAGYKVPVANAFCTFTAMNSVWKEYPSTGWGRDFPSNIGSALFPASGYRNYYDDKLYDTRGHYWTASCNDSKYGCHLSFDKDKVHLNHNANRACGNAIRPIKDE